MREVVFTKKSRPHWDKIEQYLSGKEQMDSDQLAAAYVRINDDLSYANTHYPDSTIVTYLNKIAQQLHRALYKNKKEKKSRLKQFWWYEVPAAARAAHKEMLYALIIFCVAIGIGMYSSAVDDTFVRLILGDAYVNMTLDNISNGDPMAVYKSHGEGSMFLGIGSNNVRVAFMAFALGILGSVITAYILFSNGVMVGAFQYFFIKQGLGWISFSTIFLHGALELSAIVIAGAAGLVLGNAWLFPDTYTRGHSLAQGARRSLKIIVGLVPVFVFAAFIESYVTRWYQEMPNILRIAIIAISFIWVLYYFVIYPIKLEKRGITESTYS